MCSLPKNGRFYHAAVRNCWQMILTIERAVWKGQHLYRQIRRAIDILARIAYRKAEMIAGGALKIRLALGATYTASITWASD